MTPAEIIALAESTPTTDIPTASAALGMGANLGYHLASKGEFPVRVLRLGRKLRVPTADILVLLGISSIRVAPDQIPASVHTTLVLAGPLVRP